MDNYDLNIDWAKTTIEVTLQEFGYIGHYRIEVKGNVKGANALEEALDTFNLNNADIIWNDCNMEIFENFEGEDCFKVVLKDKEGNELLTDDYLTELEDLVVATKIIDYKKVEERN